MKDLAIFIINPILYIIYKIVNYKKFLVSKKEGIFALSLAIVGTYIPYNAGDSIRYAFKYYELLLFPMKEAWNNYLPHQDYLYYGTLFLFSRLGLPYHIFLIFTTFIIYYIILSLLKNIISSKRKILYFLYLYMPINISLGIRFPLASYIMVYSFYKKKKFIKILLVISALLIHEASSVIFLAFLLNNFINKYLKKVNIKLLTIILIFINSCFYFNLSIIYKNFPEFYIIQKAFNYSKKELSDVFFNVLITKLGLIWIFVILAFIFSYIYLFCLKNIKSKEYNFLLIFGGIIITFIRIPDALFRFSWIFNIFFVIFIMKNNNKNNKLLLIYKFLYLCHASLNTLILIYYSSFFYIKNYNVIPQFVFPTPIQIIGVSNKYNEKIETIVKKYPEKEILGRSIMAKLEEYY